MATRPRTGRGMPGRDGNKDADVEADILARVIEGVKKAKEFNDNSRRIGQEIVALEEDIKAEGQSTVEQHRRLDELYRENLRNAEQEKKAHEEEDLVNNLAILATMRSTDEPAPRNGHAPKSRKPPRAPVETEIAVDSPGPSPSDNRSEILKRIKGTAQRSSSVVSQGRANATVIKEDSEPNRGVLAERAGQLVIGAEVFYKFPKGSPEDLGAGIQCIVKKVWLDKKPIAYDVQDPEPDGTGKQNVHKATARDLIPIPSSGAQLPVFANGSNVFARYPETDTFYKAKVRGIQKGLYTLRFEGEEDDKEMAVDKRYVLDTRLR